jgi:hypothetical protein
MVVDPACTSQRSGARGAVERFADRGLNGSIRIDRALYRSNCRSEILKARIEVLLLLGLARMLLLVEVAIDPFLAAELDHRPDGAPAMVRPAMPISAM